MNEITRLMNLFDWLADNEATLHFQRPHGEKHTTVVLRTHRHETRMAIDDVERSTSRRHIVSVVIEKMIEDVAANGGYTALHSIGEVMRGVGRCT